jgi:hypothetical protein
MGIKTKKHSRRWAYVQLLKGLKVKYKNDSSGDYFIMDEFGNINKCSEDDNSGVRNTNLYGSNNFEVVS